MMTLEEELQAKPSRRVDEDSGGGRGDCGHHLVDTDDEFSGFVDDSTTSAAAVAISISRTNLKSSSSSSSNSSSLMSSPPFDDLNGKNFKFIRFCYCFRFTTGTAT